MKRFIVVRPKLLDMISEAVIPAKAGIQTASGPEGPMAQRENTGFRVKPGMTIKVKGLLTRYTSPKISAIRIINHSWPTRFKNNYI